MAVTNQIHSIIVPASAANFTAHTYSEIYCGADATVAINGISGVTMANGSSIKITVRSISATAGIYLLGDNINVSSDTPILLT